MKNGTVALKNALAQEYSIKALPRLRAEWNMNRYYPTVCDNTPSEDSQGFDIELFPIESLAKPLRPTKGINKARVGEAIASAELAEPLPPRFYIGDYNDNYKYWTSPDPSNGTGVLANCSPFVAYGTRDATTQVITYQTVKMNKIVVTFENSWAAPYTYNINARINGVWTTIFNQSNVTDTTWERTGKLELYYDGTNWRQPRPANHVTATNISGINVNVTALKGGIEADGTTSTYVTAANPTTKVFTTGFNSHCDIIEIGARLELDLTSDLVSVNDTMDIGEASNLYPIGTLTTNEGDITLWNGDSRYDTENDSSDLAGLLEPNVEFTLDYIYTLPSGATEEVRQFTMYGEGFAGQKNDEATVALMDHSKFFQEQRPRAAMWEGLTVPQILFRLCDSIGFSKYRIVPENQVTNFVIPVFWVNGEANMWEILDELAKASQTAIYFDHTGTLQCKTRDAAMDHTKAVDATLRGEASGSTLANIINANVTTDYEANTVKVSYATTRWSDYNNGHPTMQPVWEPEDTMAVRSTQLARSIPAATSDMFYISAKEAVLWNYTGVVNINAEIIRYEGLEFAYYTTITTRNLVIVKSADEKKKYHEMTPVEYRYKNALTGGIKVATKNGVLQRGIWNSQAEAHSVDAKKAASISDSSGYLTRGYIDGVRHSPWGSLTHIPAESKVQLKMSYATRDYNDVLLSTIGSNVDSGYSFYGTRLRFVKETGQTAQRGGILFNSVGTGTEDGYFVELIATNKISPEMRALRHELLFYTRKNGKMIAKGGTGNRGARLLVEENKDYDIDVRFRVNGAVHEIKVWVNGKLYLNFTIGGTDRNTSNGKFGMFIRGKTTTKYEYLYALLRDEADPADDFSWLDKRTGGYVSNLFKYEWVYRMATKTRIINRKSTQVTYRYNTKFFDEFGPYVHEIREFDVKFEPNPVLHSRPFLTNDWTAAVLEYLPTPFGAKMTIANIARINSIIHGEDTSVGGVDNPVDQVFNILGRPLVIDEAKEYEVKNEAQIQRRGVIESELSSDWIQTESMAKGVADWVLKNMSNGNEEMTVEVFGNPLYQLTDVVDVYYADKSLNGEKYFIVGIDTEWDAGITTTLTLRRANPAAV